MRKTWKWRDKLTKDQLAHIKETGATTLNQVINNVEYQENLAFPCWVCLSIGEALKDEIKQRLIKV